VSRKKSSAPEPLLFKEEVRYAADPSHRGWRLDAFLAHFMRWRSRSSIKSLVQDGLVSIHRGTDVRVVKKASATILDGDSVAVTLPKPKRDVDFGAEGPPADPDMQILFEDRWLVAVDKPPNVAVHPAGRNLYRTVITALHRRYRRPDDPEHDIVPKLCHRLDYETSGVLLAAKDDVAHRRRRVARRGRSRRRPRRGSRRRRTSPE